MMKKERFLEIVQAERRRWEELLSQVGEARMTRTGVAGPWSVRDIVVHITAYERGLVEWLTAAAQGEVAVFPVLDHPDVDYRNEVIIRDSAGQSLQEVLSAAEHAFGRFLRLVEELPEEELLDAERREWYVRPRWKERRALWECIADDSYRHYQQHAADIRAWREK